MRRFLATVGHYRRFINGFGEICEPLQRLVRQGARWHWGQKEQAAYDELKNRLCKAPILALPDMDKPFILEPDAAQGEGDARSCLGAALRQEQGGVRRVIAYGSKVLTAEQTRSYQNKTSELELYSVVHWLKHWRHYLHGHDVTVITDHKPLIPIINDSGGRAAKEQTRIANLALKLEEFRPGLKAQWCPGKEHTLADAMTRGPIANPGDLTVRAAPATGKQQSLPDEADTNRRRKKPDRPAEERKKLDDMRQAQLADPVLGDVIVYLESESLPDNAKRAKRAVALASHMFMEDDVLYNNWWPTGGHTTRTDTKCQLAVPRGNLREDIMEEHHSGPLGGHLHWKKVHERIREKYWWPRMVADIKDYVASCEECQQRNEGHRNKYGLLEPIAFEDAPWKSITIDFSGEMPETERGNKHILVMVCNSTKAVELRAVKSPSAQAAAEGLAEDVVYRHGCPAKIGSDRGSHFTGEVLGHLAKILGAKQHFSVAYHAQSHGQVEIMLKNVQKILSHLVSQHQRDWDTALGRAAAIIRFSPNETTGESPFFLTYGRDPRLPIDTALPVLEKYEQDHRPGIGEQAKELAKNMAEVFKQVKEHVEMKQGWMKKQYDKNRVPAPPELDVGRKVMLKAPKVDFPGTSHKLARPWKGPYLVEKKLSELNRLVRNCNNPDDIQTVHVERLKPFIQRKRDSEGADSDDEEDEEEFEIEEILQERPLKRGGCEYLVKFKGYSKRNNEWVPEENLHAPDLLERFMRRPEEARRQPLPTTRRRNPKEAQAPRLPTKKTKKQTEKEMDEFEGSEPQQQMTKSGRRTQPRTRLDL